MKTIVVAGACSNVGKTTLAESLGQLLPGAEVVKIGSGERKDQSEQILYPLGTSFQQIKARHGQARYLIIESNQILCQHRPDLCIYLDGQPEKPSAELAKQMADLKRGQGVTNERIKNLTSRLEVDLEVMREICLLAGTYPSPVSAVILAGGDSSRMKRDKALLSFRGKSLVQHNYEILSQFCDEVFISTGQQTSTLVPGVHQVTDLLPGKGPLMGIYSGVMGASHDPCFVIACDIPLLDISLFKQLLSYSFSYDIVVPSFSPGTYEPLFAWYSKRTIETARFLLSGEKRRVAEIFSLCQTKVFEVEKPGWYINLNTPEDYEYLLKREEEKSYDTL